MSTLTHLLKDPETIDLTRVLAGFRRLGHEMVAVWESIGEGAAASRRYRELTARGMSHDAAAAKIFADHFAGR